MSTQKEEKHKEEHKEVKEELKEEHKEEHKEVKEEQKEKQLLEKLEKEKKPIQVITVAYNRPDFISLQYHSLCKYLKGPWTMLVFSDAQVDQDNNDHKIKAACRKIHVQHIRVPPYIQTVPGPSPRAGNALDWALKNYAYNYDGFTLVMDSDMFLVKKLDLIDFMTNKENEIMYDMAGVVQTMSFSGYWFRYLWMALLVINGSSMKNKDKHADQIRFMNGVFVEGLSTDAGGPMHYYLENHPDLNIKPLKHMWSGSWTLDEIVELGYDKKEYEPFLQYLNAEKSDKEIAGIGEMISSYFYHYRAGSNWNQLSEEVVDRRAWNLNEYMKTVLNGSYCNYSVGPNLTSELSSEILEELIAIYRLIPNVNSVLSLALSSREPTAYDSDIFRRVRVSGSPGISNILRFNSPSRMGKNDEKEEEEVYELDPYLWNMIFKKAPNMEATEMRAINIGMKRFQIKKQHHYQIIVMGQTLHPNTSVQLVCHGDTFFGALDAKEFSLDSEFSVIKWDFYNKFETKIDIGLKAIDSRGLPAPADTYKIRRAYLSCLGPLG